MCKHNQGHIFAGMKLITLIPIACCFTACLHTQSADMVVHNALIITLDDNQPTAQAMAISNGRIIELGAEREILNRYKSAQMYDARKMYIYPGFIDAHAHFIGYARNKAELSLHGAQSAQDMVARVVAFAKRSERDWIIGRGWDQNLWEDTRFPSNETLDSLFPERPVLLTRIDGHAALANSAALRRAGIKASTQVAGGKILIRSDGTPTGMLIDRAIDRVARFVPTLPDTLLVKHLIEAERDCFEAGLTTVSDLGITVKEAHFLDSLQKAGLLDIRIYASLRPDDNSFQFMAIGPMVTDAFTLRSVKMYADGALGSRGALLKQPYSDDPDNNGLLLTPMEELSRWAERCMDYGYQLNTHCIGDSANALVLQCYANHLKEMNDRRWRIEHAQVVSPSDRSMFATYGIIPSVQPVHATSDGPWAEQRLGAHRLDHAYAFESLRQQLGIIALGTDFPVEGIAPLATFQAAVFRTPYSQIDAEPFQTDEAMGAAHALNGMSLWAAIACFEEENRGSLESGKWADFVVLNRDLRSISASDMPKVKVIQTFVSGQAKIP